MFHLGDALPGDLETAAALAAPLLAINALIMLPEWNSWSLPKLNAAEEAKAIAAPLPSKPATTNGLSVALPGTDAAESTSSSPAASVSVSSSSASAASASSSSPTAVPASEWGTKGRGGMTAVRRLKDALHLAQGHYTANNPTGSINVALELSIAAINSMAMELLYRGVAVTLIGDWLCDRYYEAGADDAILLPSWFHDGVVTTPEAAKWSAALVMVGISAVLAIRRVSRNV